MCQFNCFGKWFVPVVAFGDIFFFTSLELVLCVPSLLMLAPHTNQLLSVYFVLSREPPMSRSQTCALGPFIWTVSILPSPGGWLQRMQSPLPLIYCLVSALRSMQRTSSIACCVRWNRATMYPHVGWLRCKSSCSYLPEFEVGSWCKIGLHLGP